MLTEEGKKREAMKRLDQQMEFNRLVDEHEKSWEHYHNLQAEEQARQETLSEIVKKTEHDRDEWEREHGRDHDYF